MSGFHLRAGAPSDAADITEMFDQPEVRRGTLRLPYTVEAGVAKWLGGFEADKRIIAAEVQDTIVGFIVLERLDGRLAHTGDLFIAVHDDFQRRGIGRALIMAALDLADNWLGLTRLQLEVMCDNEGAMKLYHSCGFEVEGRARAGTLRDGELVDHFYMGRLRDAPSRRAEDVRDAP